LRPILISTCQAPNSEFICPELAAYLTLRLQTPVEAKIDVPWQERERLLDGGQIDVCWICGLPYVRKADQSPPRVKLIAAPVMQAPRYADRPVYFSDVVVRDSSPFKDFGDLRGASWAFNEPGSHSGYNVVRYALARRGAKDGFFGRVVESGSHQNSLTMILDGEIDASAIDSTVLELELAMDERLLSRIRIIDTLGPSPIPPWVAPANMPASMFQAIQDALFGMSDDPLGRAILNKAQMARFVRVNDDDYDPIRRMAEAAEGVRFSMGQ